MGVLLKSVGVASIVSVLAPVAARAQAPAGPPPSPWTQTASAGFALTSGNKDTSTLNVGFEVGYDPKARNLLKSDGLFLRGKTEGVLSTDRLSLNGRDEYKLSSRSYTFAQMQYLGDQFKNIDYLVSPAAGLGLRLAETPQMRVSLDVGVGGVWEKPIGGDVRTSGAVTVGEKATRQLSKSASVGQSFTALYKTNDVSDSLYTFGANIAASVTSRTQLKVELLDTYKNRAAASFKKNDVAVIVGMVFKR